MANNVFDRFDRETLDPWLLSGEAVCRWWGRDYDVSTKRYIDWLLAAAAAYDVSLQLKVVSDPPGVVVRAYLEASGEPESLKEPLIAVTKKSFPWLFCGLKGCRARIADGMPPGSVCGEHAGQR